MDGTTVVVATIALIVGSAFFVAAEFSLLAAKGYRLEDAAGSSRSARAALRSHGELTVLLAGCQLGITASALGLGAVTKPAVHYALTPVFSEWGLPYWVADATGFALALVVVTFLHLVIGEMAPKSWAIAHPESSATLLALPMRAFMWLTRPLLRALNEFANVLLRRVGVEPQDTVGSGQTAADLRQLVQHSVEAGTLDERASTRLTRALDLQDLTVADVLRPDAELTAVNADACVRDVREATVASGHLRILVQGEGDLLGVVHVRDTVSEPDERPATELMRPVYTLHSSEPVHSALASMREARNHLAVVRTEDGGRSVITLNDVLNRLIAPGTAAV